ncbi:hypothetical protein CYMTET_25280 [Cymbomonas tetramitiformis]|uniref:Transmembrane protein n=1 Tax=Cymbomonas tetramitiformis TaxID=36881 RepID=A0AAE0FUV9_9CHLO|nr:hypothetical protein CYMTET_25280 [Cymbomonas tetramitiformis]
MSRMSLLITKSFDAQSMPTMYSKLQKSRGRSGLSYTRFVVFSVVAAILFCSVPQAECAEHETRGAATCEEQSEGLAVGEEVGDQDALQLGADNILVSEASLEEGLALAQEIGDNVQSRMQGAAFSIFQKFTSTADSALKTATGLTGDAISGIIDKTARKSLAKFSGASAKATASVQSATDAIVQATGGKVVEHLDTIFENTLGMKTAEASAAIPKRLNEWWTFCNSIYQVLVFVIPFYLLGFKFGLLFNALFVIFTPGKVILVTLSGVSLVFKMTWIGINAGMFGRGMVVIAFAFAYRAKKYIFEIVWRSRSKDTDIKTIREEELVELRKSVQRLHSKLDRLMPTSQGAEKKSLNSFDRHSPESLSQLPRSNSVASKKSKARYK